MLALRSFLAVLRFALELALLAVYASFGFRLGEKLVNGLDWTLGIALPALLVVIWGTFVAPRAPRRLSDPTRFALEIALFLSGTAMLVVRTQAAWGVALFAAFLVDRVLLDRLGTPRWAEPRSA